MVKGLGLLASLALFSSMTLVSGGWQSPVYPLYTFPLPIPPDAVPKKTFTSKATGKPIDYYEIDIKPVSLQLYPPPFPKTRLVGYNGLVPGPTFRIRQGREVIVRFINHGDRANSVHLHGSYSRAPFDGWADDVTEVGQYKDYYYPNGQNARTLWYHDHAVDHTAENAYFGQAGFYILSDADQDALGLPSGKYDVPLALAGKRYNSDASLWDPEKNGETTSVFGDVLHVNGMPFPYHQVEPRKYRLRFLNTGVSRSYNLWFEQEGTKNKIKFTMICSDAGLLLSPVETDNFFISIAERWELVIDFSNFKGKNVILRNARGVAADSDFEATDRVMQFRVGQTVTDTSNNLPQGLPAKLRNVPFPPAHAPVDHNFEFARGQSQWKVNGVTWSQVNSRVLARPKRGAVQKWSLKNGGGGWSHPIHIHLVDLQMVKRTGGRGAIMPYEAVALKDVMWLNVGETVEVVARYAPWDGLYMFHCHNLIHEDHEMLVAFNVSALSDLGYTDKTAFIDPMEPRYRAKPFVESEYQARTGVFSDAQISSKVDFFVGLDAYAHVEDAESALNRYWKTYSGPTEASPVPKRRDIVEARATPVPVVNGPRYPQAKRHIIL
ncbi:Cupredoxin [Lindgomyces ingoldianus]|uniref:Cupredoxin n=1 Tax=Lindgomyces ingoldianus TaxID=673940 RepID=A0ACB6QGY7_9PLEO|nr:Cupredoxin [Lindgomyces ingoldianus]KAF2466151.1 Cupredoxin [Lindgomyces ingoldianus]